MNMDATQENPMSHEEWVANIRKVVATDANSCRCPVRPWATPGSFASGSVYETRAVEAWTAEHGNHAYAKARDELAGAIQNAESRVGSGAAALDMVADVFGISRECIGDAAAMSNVTYTALCSRLSEFVGEGGGNEGAVDVLDRLLSEVRAARQGPAAAQPPPGNVGDTRETP